MRPQRAPWQAGATLLLFWLVLLGLNAGSVVARASPQDATLLLPEVMDSIRQAYPLIMAALADQRSAQGELQAARGGFDPMLRVRGDASPIGAYPNGRFDLVLEQPTPLWGASAFAGYRVSVGDFPDYDGKLVTRCV